MNRGSDLTELLRSMRPRLSDGVYVFISAPPGMDISGLDPIATFREEEGLSLVVEESQAAALGLPVLIRAAWITLTVISDLHAVGLTAAVAKAMADKAISCNVIAAANHDHLFVPFETANAAMDALDELSRGCGPSV
jgi:hypothetical protein